MWIFNHFFEFIPYYIGAIFSLYVLHRTQAEIPQLAKDLGDKVISHQMGDIKISWFFVLAFLIIIFRTLSRWLFFYPARIQQKNLRIEMIELIEKANPTNYEDYNDGQMYQVLFNDFNRLRGFIGFALLQVGNIIIAAYVLIPKIEQLHPGIFVAFTPMVLSVVIFSIVIFIFQPYLKKALDMQGEVQNVIIETFNAKSSIASFQKESSFLEQFSLISQKELLNFFKSSAGPAVARPLIPLGVSLSLLWGAVLLRDFQLEVTSLIMFSSFLFLVLEPLMFLSWIGIIMAGALGSWKRIKKLIETLEMDSDVQCQLTEYANEDKFLVPFWKNEIELEFKKNQTTGICGKTGVGKSTVLIHIANALKNADKKVSLVMQEPHLFNDTLLNNVLLGKEEKEEVLAKVRELLDLFQLDQVSNDSEELFNMIVGENGKKLSGGQIKRLALVRSLISHSDYLLWDDPFSSVDNILENQILSKLYDGGYLEGKTLIFTSHRLTTFKFASRVILLKDDHSYVVENIVNEIKNREINEFFQYQMASLSQT